jgi:hypothetical protein
LLKIWIFHSGSKGQTVASQSSIFSLWRNNLTTTKEKSRIWIKSKIQAIGVIFVKHLSSRLEETIDQHTLLLYSSKWEQ